MRNVSEMRVPLSTIVSLMKSVLRGLIPCLGRGEEEKKRRGRWGRGERKEKARDGMRRGQRDVRPEIASVFG